MHCSATTFDGLYNLESSVAGNLSHGTDGATRLLEQDIPRPGRGAGADEDTFRKPIKKLQSTPFLG